MKAGKISNENSLFVGLNVQKKEIIKKEVNKALKGETTKREAELTQTISIKGKNDLIIKKKLKKSKFLLERHQLLKMQHLSFIHH